MDEHHGSATGNRVAWQIEVCHLIRLRSVPPQPIALAG
jgi:hypothetical protein